MAMQQQYDDDQTSHPKKRSRLIIDIVPELRRRIKVAAAQNDLSVQEYVRRILDQVVPAEKTPEQELYRPLSRAWVDKLLQTREAIMRAHPGQVFEDSAETLRQIREERTRELEQL
jgi:predicted metal-dependent RNase